jgi:Prenyltransferase and squalene oxidase repeat
MDGRMNVQTAKARRREDRREEVSSWHQTHGSAVGLFGAFNNATETRESRTQILPQMKYRWTQIGILVSKFLSLSIGLPSAAKKNFSGWLSWLLGNLGAKENQLRVCLRAFAPSRFLSLLMVGTTLATPAFAQQNNPNDITVDPQTDQVIQGSLKWLSNHQQPSGSWSERQNQVAMTGYVLMSFMAGGNLPNEGPYGAAVGKGTQYLLNCVRADGYIVAPNEIRNDKGMYGHGIATIALGELYGQTGDPMIRSKLERAIHLIVSTQNQQGGWRYMPRVADADISVTVLQIVALRAAKNDGLDVPQATIDKAVAYVKACNVRGSGGFAYQPGGGPGFARTAAAIYSLQVCGLYDDPMVADGSKFLFARQGRENEWFTYGNFYAAPAQYMIGGDTWKKWYESVKQILMLHVRREGDSCSFSPVPGDQSGNNEVYVTAVDTLILAMPYHYIPLYQR